MRSAVLEKRLTKEFEELVIDATPGFVAQAYQSGKKVLDIHVGETYPYYDLASLTKILFTVTGMMSLVNDRKFDLNQSVQKRLGWFPNSQVKVSHLLSHVSGLPWWFEFYKKMNLSDSRLSRWTESARWIRKLGTRDIDQSVYSDLDFITLGHLLESEFQKPLSEVWMEIQERYFPGTRFHFQIDNQPKLSLEQYAPTENCPWRKKRMRGQVHDENTYSFGGVSSHAGLFGSVDDVSWYGLFLRSHLIGNAKLQMKISTLKSFVQRAIPQKRGDWAMGFMMPTKGTSSAGKYFSMDSIGHTGFTGTSFWYDPRKDFFVTILSNRVQMGRENKKFVALRSVLHNRIYEEIF